MAADPADLALLTREELFDELASRFSGCVLVFDLPVKKAASKEAIMGCWYRTESLAHAHGLAVTGVAFTAAQLRGWASGELGRAVEGGES